MLMEKEKEATKEPGRTAGTMITAKKRERVGTTLKKNGPGTARAVNMLNGTGTVKKRKRRKRQSIARGFFTK